MQYFDLDIVMAIAASFVIVVMLVWYGYSRKKRGAFQKEYAELSVSPTMGNALYSANDFGDDAIVAVRKKNQFDENNEMLDLEQSSNLTTEAEERTKHTQEKIQDNKKSKNDASVNDVPRILILHIMSKENVIFSGYELLQILLSVGLRFGKGNIFHYYREPNEQKDIMFSLASATEPGVFDIHNMGSCSCLGLTLFMQTSKNDYDEDARYDLMLQTAHHLAEDLGGIVLDAKRKPLAQFKLSPHSLPDELALEQ